MHFRNKTSLAQVVAERRNVVQEKYTGRGASSRRFVQKIGEMTFFCGGATEAHVFIFRVFRPRGALCNAASTSGTAVISPPSKVIVET